MEGVLSQQNFLSTEYELYSKPYKPFMTKLNSRKINWIMKELDKGTLSVRQISKIQKVSTRRVRQLREYRDKTNKVFPLKTERIICRKEITKEDIQTVATAREKYKLGSTILEKIIDKEYGKHIPHNRIQQILENGGYAVPLTKKVRRKKWVFFERKHSNSMWHTDWTMLDDGKWLITYEDDASRKFVSWGKFDNATSEHSVEILKTGIESHGKPRSILTGHDTQFYANAGEKKELGKTVFQLFLEEQKIQHILGRVNHPQTNGKEERSFGTIKAKLHEFGSLEDLIHWYNEIKPHMSLDFDNLETPSQAFIRKMHHTAKSTT
jgi:putative transposase